MKIVLLGSGGLLIEMATLCKQNGAPVSILTAPRHADENYGDKGTKYLDALRELDIPFLVSEKINAGEVKNFIGSMDDGLAISFGAAWVFSRDVIENLFQNKLFNVHGARLPRDRGAATFSWHLMRGNRMNACLIHRVSPGLDTGPVVAFEEYIYPAKCRIPADIADDFIKRNRVFVSDFILARLAGEKIETLFDQPEHLSTYFPRLSTPINGWIDWSWPGLEIEKFVCAFDDPYGGTSTRLAGKVVRIKKAQFQQEDGSFHVFQAGIVYRKGESWVLVACLGGQLIIEEVLDEKEINIVRQIKLGERFSSSVEDLEKAKVRVHFTSTGQR